MKLNLNQLEHLVSLRVADAVHKYDSRRVLRWQWQPHLAGPLIRSSVLLALEKRKLARWFGRRMKITLAGRNFLTEVTGL